MKLHEDKDTFLDLVSLLIDGCPVSLVPFRYGAKAYKLIQRFSEDIDLAVMAGDIGSNKCKKLLATSM